MAEPELKEYDGKALGGSDGSDSKPALVAVDGYGYDVSASKLWKGGLLMKRHYAGRDLSGDIAAAPHGKEVLEGEINRLLLIQELRRTSKTVNEQDIDSEVARAAGAYNFLKKESRVAP